MKLLLVLAIIFCIASSAANAQSCNFSITNLSFGSTSLTSGAAVDATATFTATCTGQRNRTIRICPNIGSGTGGNNASASIRYMTNGSSGIGYNLFQNSARTTVWGSHVWPWSPTPPTINLPIGNSGSGSTSQTIYGRILAGQGSAASGVYASAFSGGHTLISYAYSNAGNCNSIGTTNGRQVPFTVSANNSATCTVSARPLNFGSKGTLDSMVDATNAIAVTCSNGTPYQIGLNGGLSSAANPLQRRMANSSTAQFVEYGIYRDSARTLPWGSATGTNTVSATGTGTPQTFTGYGRILPQATPSPGVYSDTVVVTVTY